MSGSITKFFCAALALLGLAAVGARAVVGAVGIDLHPHLPDCQSCHLAQSDITPDNAGKLISSQEALCGRCHPSANEVSHPSGFTPGRVLPGAYPVDWKGDLTCSTCHAVHSDTPGLMRGDASGRDLCLSCHGEGFFLSMPDHGASIVRSGHLAAPIDMASLALDAYSLQCMDCHADKSDAGVVSIDLQGIVRHAGNSVNHPIGRSYAESTRFGGYRSSFELSADILLPEGKMSCVSCHKGYSETHGALSVSNNRSSLCFECHNL